MYPINGMPARQLRMSVCNVLILIDFEVGENFTFFLYHTGCQFYKTSVKKCL